MKNRETVCSSCGRLGVHARGLCQKCYRRESRKGTIGNFKLKKTFTNADKLRAMTDEELAAFIRDQIIDRNIGIPTETWLDWLRQEETE